jgi:hypothetical protein
LRSAQLNGTDFSGANIEGTVFAHANASEALNLDAARNANAAIWEDPGEAERWLTRPRWDLGGGGRARTARRR